MEIEKDDNTTLRIPPHLRELAKKNLVLAKKLEAIKIKAGYRWVKTGEREWKLLNKKKIKKYLQK